MSSIESSGVSSASAGPVAELSIPDEITLSWSLSEVSTDLWVIAFRASTTVLTIAAIASRRDQCCRDDDPGPERTTASLHRRTNPTPRTVSSETGESIAASLTRSRRM